MKKLLSAFGCKTEHQYYNITIEALVNGDESLAKERFLSMPKSHQKMMLKQILFEDSFILFDLQTEEKEFFFDILVK